MFATRKLSLFFLATMTVFGLGVTANPCLGDEGDGCQLVMVPTGELNCDWNADLNTLVCTPDYRFVFECSPDNPDDNGGPPGTGGPGNTGGGEEEDSCPSVCPRLGIIFLPLSTTACKDCNQDTTSDLDICQTVTEIMEPCPVDDGTRDCCEVQSCIDPGLTNRRCDNGGWHFSDFPDVDAYFTDPSAWS